MTYSAPPSQSHYPGYPTHHQSRTNVLAVLSFVSAFFISLLAVILGHVALAQIKRTGERGQGLAIAGLVLGYLGLLFGLLFFITVLAVAGNSSSSSSPSFEVSQRAEQSTVTLDDMEGNTLKEAESATEAEGLKYAVISPDGTTPADPENWEVTSQVPNSDTPVATGGTVTFYVKESVAEVPDVEGQTGADAKAALEDAGFKVKWNKDVQDPTKWEATGTSPAAGKEAKKGSTVKINVKRPVPTETKGGVDAYLAEGVCDYYGNQEYPYGWKAHWILGLLASEVRGDRYYVKAEVTVTNAFGQELEGNVECFVGGAADSPTLEEFNVY